MHNLSPDTIRHTITQFVESHGELSNAAYLECRFDYYERRNSLLSEWRLKNYPVRVAATLKQGQIDYELMLEVPYSSTCPCSAALARQLIQEDLKKPLGQKRN